MSPVLFWTTAVVVYTCTSLSILGVITNSFNLYLFYSDSLLCKSTRLILGYTSFCDIAFLTLIGIYEPLNTFLYEKFKKSLSKPVLFYLLNSFELLRNWLYVLLSFERLFYIVKPLEFKHFWTSKVVNITISLITLTSFLLRTPCMFLKSLTFGIVESVKEYLYYTHLLTDCVFLSFLPECLMIYVSVSTTILVRKRNIGREKLGKQKTELGLVKTFLVTFFFLTLPSISTTMARFIVDFSNIELSETSNFALSFMILMTRLCSTINSFASFFIYMNYTARYRDALIKSLGLQRLSNFCKLFQIRN